MLEDDHVQTRAPLVLALRFSEMQGKPLKTSLPSSQAAIIAAGMHTACVKLQMHVRF